MTVSRQTWAELEFQFKFDLFKINIASKLNQLSSIPPLVES